MNLLLHPVGLTTIKPHMEQESPTFTFGQKAVGITFNPSNLPEVDAIKTIFAEAIDLLNELRDKALKEGSSSAARHFSLAITYAEEAQGRGVRGVTWKD